MTVPGAATASSHLPPRSGRTELLWLAAALALAAGLLEGLVRVVQRAVFHTPIRTSLDVIWMAPLANLVWLGVPALLLTLLLLRVDAPRWRAVAGGLLGGLAAYGLTLLVPSMHRAAQLLVAAGIAVQLARVLADPGSRLLPRARRLVPRLAVLVLVLALGREGWLAFRERRAMAKIGDAAGQPNVLLLILDTARDENFSLSGYERPTTPHLGEWAARGVRFEWAVAPAPWTLPSHASMFTGRAPRELSTTLKRPLDGTFPVLAEALRTRGFATGGFVANMSYCSAEHGLARGFLHYEDYPRSIGGVVHASALGRWLSERQPLRTLTGSHDLLWRKNAAEVNREFLAWHRRIGSRPFFAFLNYFDAHQPYLPPAPYDTRFARWPERWYTPRWIDGKFSEMTADEIAWTLDRYDGSLAYLDDQIDALLRELERRGALANTIVIVTADHGEHFGEHARVSHGNSLYTQLTRVPLLMLGPGLPPGTVVSHPVSLTALPATVLDLAAQPAESSFAVRSLVPVWRDGAPPTDPVQSEMPGAMAAFGYSLYAMGHHYINWFRAEAELFDLARDPQETRNLAGDSAAAPLLARLDAMAAALRPVADSSRRRVVVPDGGVVDADNDSPVQGEP